MKNKTPKTSEKLKNLSKNKPKAKIKDAYITLKISLDGARKHVETLKNVQDKVNRLASIGWLLSKLDPESTNFGDEYNSDSVWELVHLGEAIKQITEDVTEDFYFFKGNILHPIETALDRVEEGGKADV